MKAFVDTSALYALASASDRNHQAARRTYVRLIRDGWQLTTTSYVVLESVALIQRRMGFQVARGLHESLDTAYTVVWVDEALHRRGWERLQSDARRGLSLVDCVSFEVMDSSGLTTAFAFDAHFQECGYLRP